MEETMMNETELEALNDELETLADLEQQDQDVVETNSNPNGGVIALVVGGAVALAGGAVYLWKRHKKKKAEVQEQKDVKNDESEEDADFELEVEDDEEPEEVKEKK